MGLFDFSKSKFPHYTGTGVCDVCNQSLNGVKSYVVPNDVFYNSPKWRDHYKNQNALAKMLGMALTDADIERMRRSDTSQGSAVCEKCIHMFE